MNYGVRIFFSENLMVFLSYFSEFAPIFIGMVICSPKYESRYSAKQGAA